MTSLATQKIRVAAMARNGSEEAPSCSGPPQWKGRLGEGPRKSPLSSLDRCPIFFQALDGFASSDQWSNHHRTTVIITKQNLTGKGGWPRRAPRPAVPRAYPLAANGVRWFCSRRPDGARPPLSWIPAKVGVRSVGNSLWGTACGGRYATHTLTQVGRA